ncbi:MAG: 50S ribosomal protein L10 [Dehalococcoidales bacterium]|nr:50S ribosomal protein L10 [Dehalococcoidales bacterium]
MGKEEKAKIIDGIEEEFKKCTIGILTDYRGLRTGQLTTLRRKIQETGGDYKVVKNTLARFAATRTGKKDLADSFEGPVAIAYGYDDITNPAKAIAAFMRESRLTIEIKGGFTGDTVLTPQQVASLATLPSREVLIAKMLGGMNAPITGLVNCLAGPIRGLVNVLQAQIKQLEEN